MAQHHHHHHHHSGRSSRRSIAPFAWLLLVGVCVSVMLVQTTNDMPVPEAPQRLYPGTPDAHRSHVLPQTAKEASDRYHRSCDSPDTVYADDGGVKINNRAKQQSQKQQAAPDAPKTAKQPRGTTTTAAGTATLSTTRKEQITLSTISHNNNKPADTAGNPEPAGLWFLYCLTLQ